MADGRLKIGAFFLKIGDNYIRIGPAPVGPTPGIPFFNEDIFDETTLQDFIAVEGNIVLWLVESIDPSGSPTSPLITAVSDCVSVPIGPESDIPIPVAGANHRHGQFFFIYGTGPSPVVTFTNVDNQDTPIAMTGAAALPEGDSDGNWDVADGTGDPLTVDLSVTAVATSVIIASASIVFLSSFDTEPVAPFTLLSSPSVQQSGAYVTGETSATPGWSSDEFTDGNNFGGMIAVCIEVLM